MERGIHLHTNKPPACFRKYEKVEKVQFPSGQEKKKKICSNKLVFKSQSNIILVTWVNLGGRAN